MEHSFYEKEERCRRVFEWTLRKYGGVWHLCTPGEKQALIFKDDIDLNDPAQHPFVNIIAARTADKDNEIYLKVVDAYHSERVANAILEVYKKAAIPAFDY